MRTENADWVRACALTHTLGESPLWCVRTQMLYWVDVRAPALFRLDPANGDTRQWPMPALIGGVALARDGQLMLGLATGLFLFDPASAAITPYLAPEPVELGNRLNETKCDRQGRLWTGSMRDFGTATTGSLYRVEAGRATRVLTDITIPNGQNWSPDNATFYFSDTRDGRIRAYPFDAASGELGAMRVLVDADVLPGRPDGMTVDAEGFLWSARYAGGGDRAHRPGRKGRAIRQLAGVTAVVRDVRRPRSRCAVCHDVAPEALRRGAGARTAGGGVAGGAGRGEGDGGDAVRRVAPAWSVRMVGLQ